MEILIIIWIVCSIITLYEYSFMYEYQDSWKNWFIIVTILFLAAPAMTISILVMSIYGYCFDDFLWIEEKEGDNNDKNEDGE